MVVIVIIQIAHRSIRPRFNKKGNVVGFRINIPNSYDNLIKTDKKYTVILVEEHE